jgi:hypothetical protein
MPSIVAQHAGFSSMLRQSCCYAQEGKTMAKSLKTVIPELDNAAIRRTPDGKCSVYDLISIVGGQKNPRRVWNDLKSKYPEVVRKTYNFKFPGRGQRETPVTDREGWAYILGLLPGVMGRKYRESAASLVIRYLDADIKLAAEVVDRNENQGDLEWLEARLRGKVNRKRFTSVLKAHGVRNRGYGKCTNMTYTGLFGTNKDGLLKRYGLPKGANFRDHASISDLNTLAFSEDLEGKSIEKRQDQGNVQCAQTCYNVARRVAEFTQEILGT